MNEGFRGSGLNCGWYQWGLWLRTLCRKVKLGYERVLANIGARGIGYGVEGPDMIETDIWVAWVYFYGEG